MYIYYIYIIYIYIYTYIYIYIDNVGKNVLQNLRWQCRGNIFERKLKIHYTENINFIVNTVFSDDKIPKETIH